MEIFVTQSVAQGKDSKEANSGKRFYLSLNDIPSPGLNTTFGLVWP